MQSDNTYYLKKLISQGENSQLDFKYLISDSKKIAKTISAFANTKGGILLLGVKDNGSIKGVKSEEEIYMIEAAISLYCKPKVEYFFRNLISNNKIVVEVTINVAYKKPIYALDNNNNWIAYYRLNDKNIILPKVIKKIWELDKRQIPLTIKYTKLEKWLLTFLSKKEFITISQLAELTNITYKEAEECLAKLSHAKIIDYYCTMEDVYFKIR